MKTSTQLQADFDRLLNTPRHLREFEEQCWMRSAPRQISMLRAAEREAAEKVAQISRT